MTTTKAHDIVNWIKFKHPELKTDQELFIFFYNMTDDEFDMALSPYDPDDFGLHAEWD